MVFSALMILPPVIHNNTLYHRALQRLEHISLTQVLPNQTLHSPNSFAFAVTSIIFRAIACPAINTIRSHRFPGTLQRIANLPGVARVFLPKSSTRTGPERNISSRRVFASVWTLFATQPQS